MLYDPITMYNDFVTIKIIHLELDAVAQLRGRLQRISEFELSLGYIMNSKDSLGGT